MIWLITILLPPIAAILFRLWLTAKKNRLKRDLKRLQRYLNDNEIEDVRKIMRGEA